MATDHKGDKAEKFDPNEYPKNVIVDGVTLVARSKEHEEALLAGKGDPSVLEAEQARLDADAAEKRKLAEEAELKAKEAEDAAKGPRLRTDPDAPPIKPDTRHTPPAPRKK